MCARVQLSTGREVLASFMELLCAATRMALLLDESTPRQQLPPVSRAALRSLAHRATGTDCGSHRHFTPSSPCVARS